MKRTVVPGTDLREGDRVQLNRSGVLLTVTQTTSEWKPGRALAGLSSPVLPCATGMSDAGRECNLYPDDEYLVVSE